MIIFLVEILYGLQYGNFGDENFKDALSNLFKEYGFSLQNLLNGRYWTLVTSSFLHADPEHLLLNMTALFFFGRVVEMGVGRKKFIMILLASSIVGNLSFLVPSFFLGSLETVIGASGIVFGLMGTAMLIKPLEFVFFPYIIPIPLILVAVFYTLYNIAAFFLVAANIEESNISYITHISGLAVGILFGLKEEKSKKSLIIILFILMVLILTPFLWMLFDYLEVFNYVSVFSKFFK
jgi:membrane associated rhomboid family serine protease